MNESEAIYNELNGRWKATCKLLLGEEVGELKDYEEWLSSRRGRLGFTTVTPGNKKISVFLPHRSGNERVIPFEKVDFNRKFEPLNINEIKDIDSIVQAVSERVCYAGNIVLGTSKHVEESNDIMDSFYLRSSSQIWTSKYMAYSSVIEYGENLFGCTYNGNFKFCIRSHSGDYLIRCLELDQSYQSSDCHYCFDVSGAKNCMFCFNLQNPVNRIGNIQLMRDKYVSLRAKLLSEMAGLLRKDKRLPSLSELAAGQPPDFSVVEAVKKSGSPPIDDYGADTREVEAEFSSTATVLFGRKFGPMKKYEKWLSRFSALPPKKVNSAFDGRELSLPDYCNNFNYPEDRVMTRAHALAAGRSSGTTKGALDDLNFAGIPKLIAGIAFFTHEYNMGKSMNLVDTEITKNAINCKSASVVLDSKNCGYGSYAVESNAVFGFNSVRQSSYAMKCYLSGNLARCFEVDSSRACTDSYFLHNCENVRDSMFCFNTKNRRNAIGNAEIPRDKYLGIKEKVKSELAEEIDKTGGLRISIFNLVK